VTVTLERPRSARPAAPPPRSPLASGAAAALWAVVLGLAVVAVPVLVVWVAAPHDGTGPGDALRAGVLGWLLAHHADLQTPTGTLSLVPLGLLVVPAVVCWRAARWAGRVAGERSLAATLGVVAAFVATYATTVALVASLASSGGIAVHGGSTLAGACAIALGAGGLGAMQGADLLGPQVARLPHRVRLTARGAAAGFAVLVGGGALLLAVSLALHAGQVTDLTRALRPDPVGGVALLVLGLLALPGALAWAASFAVGPGFAVGVGTSVAPSGVELGDVPAFPLFGALPGSGAPSALAVAALAVPLVAGAVVGALGARHSPERDGPTAGLALVAGLLAGALLGVLAAVSAGSLGGARLAVLGPAGGQVGLAAGLEVGVVAAAVAFEGRRHAALLARARGSAAARVRPVAQTLDPRRLRRGR
jgi:hypothetical protein